MSEQAINWNNQGVQHFLNQEWEKAHQCYHKALALDDKNPAVWNNLGLLAHQQKNFSQACEKFQRAFQLEPKSNYLVNEANALVMQGDFDRAESIYLRALKLQDDYVPSLVSLAKLYTHQGRLADAESVYRRLIQISDEEEHPFQLALLQIQQGKYDDALQMLHRLAKGRDSVEIWFQIGRAEFLAKNYGRADRAFKKALAKYPDDKVSRNFYALNLLALGQPEQALTQYFFLAKFFPDDVDILTDTAVVLCSLERFAEANSYLDRAIEIRPDHQKALLYKKRITEFQRG